MSYSGSKRKYGAVIDLTKTQVVKTAPKRRAPTRGRFSGRPRELKFFDTGLSFQVDNTAEIPATGQLALIPQNDTQSGREGNRAYVTSVNIHGIMSYDPAASASSAVGTVVYLYLIQDTQANGAAATVADANSGIFTGANLATAQRTVVNYQRFKVLKKWCMEFNPMAGVTTAYASQMKAFDWYGKVSVPLVYDASATDGSIGTIRSNNIFLVAGTGGLGDDQVTVNGTCRLRFMDSS